MASTYLTTCKVALINLRSPIWIIFSLPTRTLYAFLISYLLDAAPISFCYRLILIKTPVCIFSASFIFLFLHNEFYISIYLTVIVNYFNNVIASLGMM